MNNPEHYAETNTLSKDDARIFLKKFENLIQWRDNENILDVGCGDGSVTLEVLLPALPKTYNKIVAFDVSKEMVEFARKQHNNPKVQFLQLNAESSEIPPEFKNHFHHIFSFYCLQMVPDQRRCFKNFFDMLKPGGQILVAIIATTPQIDAHVALSKTQKWAQHLQEYNKSLSPYQYAKDPENDLKKILSLEGYEINFCKLESRQFPFSEPVFDKFICSLSPYIKGLPDTEKDKFAHDLLEETRKLKNIEVQNNNGETTVVFKYKVLLAFASKPT